MTTRTFEVWYADQVGTITGAGATSTVSFQRLIDMFWFNFATGLFASSVSSTDGLRNLTEVLGGPRGGLYYFTQDITAWNPGIYRIDIELNFSGRPTQRYSAEFDVAGGAVMTVLPAPPPGVGAYCNVYTYVRGQDDTTIPATITATALITKLPYSYNGSLHIGDSITGTYDPLSGLLQWNIVQGAEVQFDCSELGLVGTVCTIPLTTQTTLAAILPPTV